MKFFFQVLEAVGFEPGTLWWLAVTLTTRLGWGPEIEILRNII